MLFTSSSFILLVISTFILFYIPVFKKYQTHILICASLIFYSYHNPWMLILLIVSILANAIICFKLIGHSVSNKQIVSYGIIVNLLILGVFKYAGLIGNTFFNGTSLEQLLLTIPLPIGISFFTFQGISLIIDTSKENIQNQRPEPFIHHFKNIFLFICFFPQLLAGPVVKAKDFIPQIQQKKISSIDWTLVLKCLITGYFLKMVIADNLNAYTNEILAPEYHSSLTLLTLLIGFSFQIFADFAGYSLIAIGFGYLFGYKLPTNFNFPYISKSFSEFWRRWHISLSSFLKEYLYIPLGGNRINNLRTYLNLFIVMFLGGLWHGAAWNFAIWGVFHGIALAIERYTDSVIKPAIEKLRLEYMPRTATIVKIPHWFRPFFKMVLVFLFVSFAWLFFKLPDLETVIVFVNSLFNNFTFYPIINIALALPIFILGFPVILYHIHYLFKEKHPDFLRKKLIMSDISHSIMLYLIITSPGSSIDFIYFQF